MLTGALVGAELKAVFGGEERVATFDAGVECVAPLARKLLDFASLRWSAAIASSSPAPRSRAMGRPVVPTGGYSLPVSRDEWRPGQPRFGMQIVAEGRVWSKAKASQHAS